MTVPAASPAASAFSMARRRQVPVRGFALVVTLLIVSLLAIVAVSFLTSMSSEHQTANAYLSRTRAEQAAQAGVDAAEAILAQSFRDYPDSCTVWDTQQTPNASNPAANTVGGAYNEGTSLYLHAVDSGSGSANPLYKDPNNPAGAANYAQGNNPSNLTCKTFKLPLISGVPGGNAYLASTRTGTLASMNLGETDPTKQNWVDLNVRRSAGDIQGIIGSPPGWSGTPNGASGIGPKPARAYWITFKSSNNLITGRYAFWVDDESFRANSSLLGNAGTRLDNSTRPPGATANTYRSLQPSDLSLLGPLMQAGSMINSGYSLTSAIADSNAILATRGNYPDSFFPDLLAFNHYAGTLPASTPAATPAAGGADFSTAMLDALRYVTTNQSGTLNLTRHGTQRLNLNNVVPKTDPNIVTSASVAQTQINQIVQTLKFHLPYFGERFYRTTTSASSTTLNDATQVPGSPKTSATVGAGLMDHSEIYYYKVAANIRDYLDTDTQPTIVNAGGQVAPTGKPNSALNGGGSGTNEIWAEGKEISPYLQEAAVRMRPVVSPKADPVTGSYPWTLQMDYYLEFWNMSDHDIYAAEQSNDPTLASLHGAVVRITNTNIWELSPSPYGAVPTDDTKDPYRISNGGPQNDYEIDLSHDVRLNGSKGQLVQGGVVFKAGAITVITTDPDCATYVFTSPYKQPGSSSSAIPVTINPYASNPNNTYYCPDLLHGTRIFTGKIPKTSKGLQPQFRDANYSYDYETEVTLCNSYGYLDSVPFAIDERQHYATWYSDTDAVYHDYSYSSCLMGNYIDPGLYFPPLPSQLGDPRTNNEQLSIMPYVPSGTGDQSHYIYGTGKDVSLGYSNPSQKFDIKGGGAVGYQWPDYYALPTPQYPPTSLPDPMNALSAPMVIADGPLTSIGQLGDVYDPARLPGASSAISLSRGGGRTFKIGQRDDRYSGDPTGNNTATNGLDAVPASNAWASWRLTDVFSVDDLIEQPARINVNGILRDKGAALLAAFQGFKFQPTTNSSDPVIHGDGHLSPSFAGSSLDATNPSSGVSQLIAQMTNRLISQSPVNSTGGPYMPTGPFFERGELGEIGDSGNALFGMSDPMSTTASGSSQALVAGVDLYRTFDHSREELFRRVSELICTRGDTFTVYTIGQSIFQTAVSGPLKVTGTQRMRVTFRLVPKLADNTDFHPGYTVDGSNVVHATTPDDVITGNRFIKPDHYAVQVLSVTKL